MDLRLLELAVELTEVEDDLEGVVADVEGVGVPALR
jgi:hypothetical protein